MSSWVSPVQGWGSEVSCPRTLPRKNSEDPVRLVPRTPGLRVKRMVGENGPWCLKRGSIPLYQSIHEFEKAPSSKLALVFTCLQYKSFENTAVKGEIARNDQFLFFRQCCLSRIFCQFHQMKNCRLQTLRVWKSLKFVRTLERVKCLTCLHYSLILSSSSWCVTVKHTDTFSRSKSPIKS